MTARFHRADQVRLSGQPLILARATTATATVCTTKNVFVPLDIGTFFNLVSETSDQIIRSPDWAHTDIAGTDHKIEPVWPAGIYQLPCLCHLYSAACGTSDAGAEDFVIALYDVQTYSTPALGAELLWAQTLLACPATATDDTLELQFVFVCKHDADLRFFVKNLTAAAHNFECDPLQLSFQVLV